MGGLHANIPVGRSRRTRRRKPLSVGSGATLRWSFRDVRLALAGRLAAAGVAADLRVYPGAAHSFLEAVSVSPLAGLAFDEAAAWLREIMR